MRWGFQRHWTSQTIINATAEKVATSRVLKKAFEERRCIDPADGFYEWKEVDPGSSPGQGSGKQPYRIWIE